MHNLHHYWRNEMETVLKRAAAALLTAVIILMPVATVCAEPAAEETQAGDEAGATAEQNAENSELERQKKASYDTVPETNTIEGWPQGPKVYANSAIVMDMNSKAVLYEKKIDKPHYPASITKLLTALVTFENASLDDEIVFSQESIDILRSDYASIGMKPGEILSLNDAMYAMLLASANEVSYAIAENVGKEMGGGYDTFIQEMNDRSAELGCAGSHWTNANGLPDKNHYTTAQDMALITAELYQHKDFQIIAQTLNYTIGTTNLVNETRTFQQHHKMLMPDNSNYYQYCTGGKTGYTDEARSTLVTTADNGKLQLVAVVLQDDGDVYEDTRAILDYAFENFSSLSLIEQEKPEEVKSYVDAEPYIVVPNGIGVSDLEYEITVEDEKKASDDIMFSYGGQEVGSVPVTLTPEYIEEATGYTTRLRLVDDGQNSSEDGILPFSRWTLAAVGVVLLLVVIAVVSYSRRRAVKVRKRRGMKKHHKRIKKS